MNVTRTVTIHREDEEELKASCEKYFAKFSKKMGIGKEDMGVKVVEYIKEQDPKDHAIYYDKAVVEVMFPDVTANNWEFIAKIDNDLHSESVIRRVPGTTTEIPETYKHVDHTVCDHCGVNRFRTCVYIIHNKVTGDFKQVGSSCLGDFIGYKNIDAVLSMYLKFYDELQEYKEREAPVSRGFITVDFNEFALYAYCVIKKLGYVSRKNSEELEGAKRPTADYLFDHFYCNDWQFGPCSKNPLFTREELEAMMETEDATTFAEKLNTFYNNEFMNNANAYTSEFWTNFKIIIKDGFVKHNEIGYAAYAIFNYIKSTEEKKAATARVSEHVPGNVGDKVQLEVTCYAANMFENDFGVGEFVMMKDKEGRTVVWKTGSNIKWDYATKQNVHIHVDVDKTYMVQATIKSFSEYKGIKQTNVTRLKVIKEI